MHNWRHKVLCERDKIIEKKKCLAHLIAEIKKAELFILPFSNDSASDNRLEKWKRYISTFLSYIYMEGNVWNFIMSCLKADWSTAPVTVSPPLRWMTASRSFCSRLSIYRLTAMKSRSLSGFATSSNCRYVTCPTWSRIFASGELTMIRWNLFELWHGIESLAFWKTDEIRIVRVDKTDNRINNKPRTVRCIDRAGFCYSTIFEKSLRDSRA